SWEAPDSPRGKRPAPGRWTASEVRLHRYFELLRFDTRLHVDVGGVDELPQSRVVDLLTGPELYVAHELSGAFEQAIRIDKFGAAKKSDIDVSLEGIGVGESRVIHTCGWMTVMQQFPDIV